MKTLSCILGLLLFSSAVGQDLESIKKAVQSSVVIQFEGEQGLSMASGTVFNKVIEGKEHSFILSCSHSIPSIEKRFVAVYYRAPLVMRFNLTPIMYSKASGGTDLIVYHCPAKLPSLVKMSDSRSEVGEKIFHVGTPYALTHFASVFDGIVSKHNARIQPAPDPNSVSLYDTGTILSKGGCSGGGVYNEKGEYIGMLLINLDASAWSGYRHIIAIKQALKENNMSWLHNDEQVKINDILKIKLTDEGVGLKPILPTPEKKSKKNARLQRSSIQKGPSARYQAR